MALINPTVVLVQSIKQRTVDECPRPDHARWPYEESAHQATKRKTNDLRREAEHDLVTEGRLLSVEHFLRSDNVGGICAANDDVGHNSDYDVLLDVKWPWVKGPNEAQSAEACRRQNLLQGLSQRQTGQLGSNTSNGS